MFLINTLSFCLFALVMGKDPDKVQSYTALSEKTPFTAWHCNQPETITTYDMSEIKSCESPDLGRKEVQMKVQIIKAIEEHKLKVRRHLI